VNCPAVRDRLPEHALGVGDHHDATAIERHLAWCAACRKEARDLERASATMAFALAPAHPSPELGERVIGAVRRVAAPSVPPRPARRRGRRVGVVLLAAALTLAGLSLGVVLGRHPGPQQPAAVQGQQEERAFERFREAIQSAVAIDPGIKPQIGELAARHGIDASGAALTLASHTEDDQVVVWVNRLPVNGAPYLVFLTDARGDAFEVVRINKLDRDGGAMVARFVAHDVGRLHHMIVRDARGRIVLAGSLAPADSAG
jgi:anti-sigma factor RsiW